MIYRLLIKNLALIESAEISFEKGLNVLTGETGAGKTIVLTALGLILGKRAQTNLLRTGADKASVEATFQLDDSSPTWKILEEFGIDYDPSEMLIISRQLTADGKSRAQINCQTVPLPVLQKVGCSLCDLIDQSSHQELKQIENLRELLDLYAEAVDLRKEFEGSWEKENALKAEHEKLVKLSEKRDQESEFLSYQLEELQEARLHEEESCFAEYQLLARRKELLEKVHNIQGALSDSPHAVLNQLSKLKSALESVAKIDPELEKTLPLFQEALIPLREVGELLNSCLDQKEADPKRLLYLDERLAKMHLLKRKIGKSTREEIALYEKSLSDQLEKLDSLDQEIKSIREQLTQVQQETESLASKLTEKRKKSAAKWQKELTTSLQALNMPSAELKLEIQPQARSASGDDLLVFLMRANKGESLLPVQACASGGELSRLLLSIKTTLAEKNQTPILVFDEIDANVGGETATLIGQNLKALAQVRQLICVTHFPQLARFAEQHMRLRKSELDGRTTTTIQTLNSLEKEKELIRMLGGEKVPK
ncbi:MAG: DNA repair protein RecN [Chlamydiales bacterium]|nr:DNA repair protein RecN [Chlamydiales bacterium]